MSAPRCLLIGSGRVAGGFVVPLLHAAGWEVILGCRSRDVLEAVNDGGGIWLRTVGDVPRDRWIGGVSAIALDDPMLPSLVETVDLVATSVGPSALESVGRMLAPWLNARLLATGVPLNVITFENHRRAPELLTMGLLEAHAPIARHFGRRLGISGAVLWRAISRRVFTDEGIRFDGDSEEECAVDAASLLHGVAPCDGSIPGLEFVRPFDDRMVEKLWLFNGGHCAAAYLGWQAGCATLDQAMARPEIRAAVKVVVEEAQQAFVSYLDSRPGSVSIRPRPIESILDRYAGSALNDPIARVGREPRRKLEAGDRLIGPSIACQAAGIRPVALATAAAAALAYGEPTDLQAAGLRRELEFLGPAEVLSAVSTLDPRDELSQLICRCYHDQARAGVVL